MPMPSLGIEKAPQFTAEEKLKVLKREIALRIQVYPTSIRLGKMKREEAQHQIDVMRAIARDYGGTG